MGGRGERDRGRGGKGGRWRKSDISVTSCLVAVPSERQRGREQERTDVAEHKGRPVCVLFMRR